MRFVRNVTICLITWIYVIITSCSGSYTTNKLIRPDRFLFTPGDVFCTLCTKLCPNGYIRSTSGCYTCACVTVSSLPPSTSFFPFTTLLPGGGVLLDRPCNPAVRHCKLSCSLGFQLGANGCQHCLCSTVPTSPVSPTSQPPATSGVPPTSTIIPFKTIPTSSTIAYHTIPSSTDIPNSTIPIPSSTFTPVQTIPTSSPIPTSPMTSSPIPTSSPIAYKTLPTTTVIPYQTVPRSTYSPPTTHVHYYKLSDPCIASQIYCTRECNGAYVKGPGGCEYCFCMAKYTTEPPLVTESPATSSIAPTSGPPPEVCMMAKVICSKKCLPDGYVSHSDDCLYCSCYKTDATDDDPGDESRVSVYILPNPCIENVYECHLRCSGGYMTGPRGCLLCSCK